MKRNVFKAVTVILGLTAGCVTHPQFEETVAPSSAPPPTAPPGHIASRQRPRTPYSFPLISIGGKFSGLPPAVQNTIRAEVGTLPLADVEKDTASGATVYKIYFENEELFPPLFIAPDGAVLNPDLTVAVAAPEEIGIPSHGAVQGLKTGDLPPAVMKTVQDRAPSGEIAHIAKEMWGEREVYIVSFKDPTHNPKLYVNADGTQVGGTHRP